MKLPKITIKILNSVKILIKKRKKKSPGWKRYLQEKEKIKTINYTNNMSAGTYAPHCNGINGDHLIASAGNVVSASCKFGHYTQANAVVDPPYGSYSMLGDLA